MCVLSVPNRVRVCRQSHRHVRFLCVLNRVRDLRQFRFTYAFLCVSNSERDVFNVNWHVQFCACRIEYECCGQSHWKCAYLCVPNRVSNSKSALLNMYVLCACRIEHDTCSQSHLTCAFRACWIEYVCCSQSCLTSMFICVPNSVRIRQNEIVGRVLLVSRVISLSAITFFTNSNVC